MPTIDARVPVRFGTMVDWQPDDAVLVEGQIAPQGFLIAHFNAAATDHPKGCACCVPRTEAARALAALFTERARGSAAFFRGVLVLATSDAGMAAVTDAVRFDPVASARYRLTP